ncbi:hypothetical protein [Actinoplanes sp. M2I2]|uniref:hypothetical protein n=1 Tax=Actinoplanes sp. M2I2 TaxID=1734444 RepID=UPI002022738C|nr:hypothetical protein [Actinoplanes sp. M2I2]
MGKSGWEYVTPYDEDLAVVLGRLRQEVFERGRYHWPAGLDRPADLDQLDDEWPAAEGTHSVLDVDYVIDAADEDSGGALRPLGDAGLERFFGTVRPSVADFERTTDSRFKGGLPAVWCGYAATLFDGGRPSAVGIWGFSGD